MFHTLVYYYFYFFCILNLNLTSDIRLVAGGKFLRENKFLASAALNCRDSLIFFFFGHLRNKLICFYHACMLVAAAVLAAVCITQENS